MTPTLIGLSGYARSGKDSAATTLIASGYRRGAFADPLRLAAERLNPLVPAPDGGTQRLTAVLRMERTLPDRWEAYKAEYGSQAEGRILLQRLGTEVLREVFGTAVHLLLLDKWLADGDPTVVTDVRYPDEADSIRERGGIVLRVNRPGVGPANAHPTESAMDDYRWFHAVIDNDGSLSDLALAVRRAVGLPILSPVNA